MFLCIVNVVDVEDLKFGVIFIYIMWVEEDGICFMCIFNKMDYVEV